MKNSRQRKTVYGLLTVVLWLLFWFALAAKIDQTLFLPSPVQVWKAFVALLGTVEFYRSIGASLCNILLGFFFACIGGSLLAAVAAKSAFAKMFIGFPVRIMQATPVASFTILALFWLESEDLSILVSFVMVLPLLYANVLTGIEETDKELLEMAQVFKIRLRHQLRYIYIPAVMPHFLAACSVAAGLAWKSGIAAEVIGVVGNTIGNHLYQSKIYMEMPELFAWTIVIIGISILFEQGLKWLIGYMEKKLAGVTELTEADRIVQEKSSSGKEHEKAEPGKKTDHLKINSRAGGKSSVLKLHHVTKRFSDVTICENFSMELGPGEKAALMGTSGIGKTTIARMLLGFEKSTEGEIENGGQQIAVVFQEDRLCKETSVYRNLAMVCHTKEQKAEIIPVLTSLGLADCVWKRVSALSGGMKRRVAIARAFLAEADTLIMDEPLKGLDETTKASVMAFMKEHMEAKTVLYITHEEAEAVYFGCKIVILQKKP